MEIKRFIRNTMPDGAVITDTQVIAQVPDKNGIYEFDNGMSAGHIEVKYHLNKRKPQVYLDCGDYTSLRSNKATDRTKIDINDKGNGRVNLLQRNETLLVSVDPRLVGWTRNPASQAILRSPLAEATKDSPKAPAEPANPEKREYKQAPVVKPRGRRVPYF